MSDFPFKLEPSERLLFSSSTLGDESCSVVLKVYNTTNEPQAFKIKCTSNDFFRLRPPVTFSPPGQEPLNINVIFNAGKQIPENGKHYFAVYGTPCTDYHNARIAFNSEKGRKAKSKKLFADFKKLAPDVPEKKEDDKKEEEKKEEKKDDEKKEEKKDDEKKEDKKE
ncbi:MSP domain and PapD-like domain-containing protein [Strongyloides ratti]|uniref:Major sperm protein n=1 Tax=Strongyloides ratti TaxID=34506 RepID=A0A090KZ29_STRRB|nr:MSP domain and PapD-like domain-containing protein [Strongyloides ratti]CEF62755.1 MSP domain and PapD-like domain-containing protein [Strongyloides ratti]